MKGVNKMSNIDILEKEYEISYMEFVNELQLFSDNEAITCYTESGSGTYSTFGKIKAKLARLFESIKKFFSNLFTDKRAKEEAEKLEANRELLEKTKIKILDQHKMMAHSKKYKEKIKNAKSTEELDKIMKEYQSGRKKLLAGAAITTITGVAVLNFWKNKQYKKYDAEVNRAYKELSDDLYAMEYTQNRAKNHKATAQDMVDKAADAAESLSKLHDAKNGALKYNHRKAADSEYINDKYKMDAKYYDLLKIGSDIFEDIKVSSEWVWYKDYDGNPIGNKTYNEAILMRQMEKYPEDK